MVKRISMGLFRSLFSISGMTLISRVLGFVRDSIIAKTFGAGFESDAFFVAFKIPNLFRRIFAEGAFSQAFVPMLATYREGKSPEETAYFLGDVAKTLSVILLLFSVLGMLAAPWVIQLTAPGFAKNDDQLALAADLLRITFPYILTISLASFVSSILNTQRMFTVPAFAPTLLNVSFIIGALYGSTYFEQPIFVLAWAVFIGGFVQLIYQLPFLLKGRLRPSLRWGWPDAGVFEIIKRMGPAMFAVSATQISLLINTAYASWLAAGTVSWMYYADRLMEFPTGMLGVALGTILLPSLSKSVAQQSKEQFSLLMDWGLRLALVLSIPSAVGLAVLGKPLIATLFMYGAFNAHDLAMTHLALLGYSVGLIGLIVLKVLAPGFYANGDVKTPVKIALICIVVTQLLNAFFYFFTPFMHAGLSLSIGLSAMINAALLYYLLGQRGIYRPHFGVMAYVARLVLSAASMAMVLLLMQYYWPFNPTFSMMHRVIYVCVGVSLGGLVYFIMAYLAGIRLGDFRRL
jgi:putative peptidoglycan lipid II flippase